MNEIAKNFSTIIPVRITDINYGKHLGHVATLGIFHHARVLFLNENNLDEMNIEGKGIILRDLNLNFKKEAKFGDHLRVYVSIGEYSKARFSFTYQAVLDSTGETVCECTEQVILFDYENKKPSRLPESFLKFCERNQTTKN